MKIAHIVCTYPPYYGGMGNVVFQTASQLAKLGHDVEVLTPQIYEEKEIKPSEEPVEETHAPDVTARIDYARRLEPSFQYGNAARLPQIGLELDNFDLVHLHYPFFGTAELVRKWKLHNPHKPLVITYHMDSRSSGWKGLAFKLYTAYWLPKILSIADKLVVSSFDYLAASDAREFYKKNPDKWIELPFGVDIDRFVPANKPVELFSRHGLRLELPTVLFVGAMDSAHYFKGVTVLIDAILKLKHSGQHIQAICVGDGNLKKQFEERVKLFSLEEQIKFAGMVTDEELPWYYTMGDILALPSTTVGEAFGMVLIEAMASGLPVIASNLPGVRTVADLAGGTIAPGNAEELANALHEYFDPATDRNVWKNQARKVAEEQFAWGPIVAKLDEVYRGLVKNF